MGRATRVKHGATWRERRFVDLLTGPCGWNATAAVIKAGYTKNRKSAAQIGSRLLRKVKVQRAIAARVAKVEAKGVADATERDEILSTFARASVEVTGDRIKAISELNKCSGRHSMKHLVAGRLTLEQILTQSREAAKP